MEAHAAQMKKQDDGVVRLVCSGSEDTGEVGTILLSVHVYSVGTCCTMYIYLITVTSNGAGTELNTKAFLWVC